jgi:hypothetical protein
VDYELESSTSQKKIKNEIVLRAIGAGAGIAFLIAGVVYFILLLNLCLRE